MFGIGSVIKQTLNFVQFRSVSLINEHKRILTELIHEPFDERLIRLDPYSEIPGINNFGEDTCTHIFGTFSYIHHLTCQHHTESLFIVSVPCVCKKIRATSSQTNCQ